MLQSAGWAACRALQVPRGQLQTNTSDLQSQTPAGRELRASGVMIWEENKVAFRVLVMFQLLIWYLGAGYMSVLMLKMH